MRRFLLPLHLVLLLLIVGANFPPASIQAERSARQSTGSTFGPPATVRTQNVPLAPIESSSPPFADPPPPSLPARAEISSGPVPSFGQLPLSFIPNVGQVADQTVRFLGRSAGAEAAFRPDELLLTIPATVPDPDREKGRRFDLRPSAQAIGLGTVRMRLEGANPAPTVAGTTPLSGVAHFFLGNQPNQQFTNVPTYQGIRYQDVYPGIDLVYDGSTSQLKSTYIVAPGVDPGQIRWRYLGGSRPQLDAAGNLQLTVPITLPAVPAIASLNPADGLPRDQAISSNENVSTGAPDDVLGQDTNTSTPPSEANQGSSAVRATTVVTVTEEAPIAWQDINGQRVPVDVRFEIERSQRVRFVLGAYDQQHPLIIDPTLVFSSYLGGAGADYPEDIALDGSGNIYLTGRTLSATLPGGTNPQATYDAFVVKLSPTGGQAVYTTYIGGDGDDAGNSIAVKASGEAYIAGYSRSTDLPVLNAYQSTRQGDGDVMAARLNASGTLSYLTYLGGTGTTTTIPEHGEYATGIAINSDGEAYITGSTNSNNFPLRNPFLDTYSGFNDLFVTKLTSSGNDTLFSSYIGGDTTADNPGGIAVDGSGNAYITGSVRPGNRSNYLTNNLIGTTFAGAFVLKVSGSGSRIFGTTFGTAYGQDVAVDSAGAAYVAGYQDFAPTSVIPIPAGAYQPTSRGKADVFLVKLAPNGQSLLSGTLLGGSENEVARDIAIDTTGTAYITGVTFSSNFPVVAPIYGANRGGRDVFVAAITGGGTGVRYSTYLGSSADDEGNGVIVTGAGDAYITGFTQGADFPIRNPIQGQNGYIGATDGFVAILSSTTIVSNDHRNTKDQWCSCPPTHWHTENPVNTRTGNFWFEVDDLAVQTQGPPIIWKRTYASQSVETNPLWRHGLPEGWRHPYASRLADANVSGEPNRTIITAPNGNRLRFEELGNNRYTPLGGVYGSLVRGSGVFTFTLRDQTRYIYNDTQGQLVAMVDPQGRRVNLGYDANGNLTTITDANDANRRLTLTYTTIAGFPRITTVSDGTRLVQYGYDTTSRLTSATDVRSRVTTYTYHPNSLRIHEIRNPLNELVERVVYDTSTPPRVSLQTLQDGSQVAFQYLAASTVMTTTGVDGRRDVDEFFYGANNAMTGIRRNSQSVLGSAFDDTLSPGTLRDGSNNTTTTRFNDSGQPLVTTNALGQQTRRSYDSRGNLTEATDALGITTRFRYDQFNNVISTTVGISTTSLVRATTLYTYTYNARYSGDSLLQEVRSPDGVVTRYEYPATGTITQRGQKIREIIGFNTPLARTTGYQYDTLGRVVTTTLALNSPLQRINVIRYNADNTVERTIENYQDGVYNSGFPDQDIITLYGYDNAGRQVWMRDVLGRNQATRYDTQGRVSWTGRNITPLQLDAQGQVITPTFSVSAPDRNVMTLYGYDGLGRTVLVTETGLLTGTFTLATRQFSQASQRVTRTQYDSLSRPITVTLNYRQGLASTADTNVNLYTRYDGAGNVITQTDALGRRTYTQYDQLNRPITVTLNFEDGKPLTGPRDADIVQVTRYDALGRVIQTIDNYVDGVFVATEAITDRITLYEYDTLSRVVTTTVNLAPGETDPSLNRVTVTRYDLTTTRTQGQRDTLGRWTSMAYDALGRVTRTTANCRDGAGNPVATNCAAYVNTARDRNVTTYTVYDVLGRTTDQYQNYVDGAYSISATDEDIRTQTVYDGVGRVTRTVRSYQDGVYNSAASDRDIVSTTTYDGLGRTTQVTDVLNASIQTGYNGLDQTVVMTDTLNRVTRMGYDGTGTKRWETTPDGRLTLFQVDALGRVVGTIQNYENGVSTAAEIDRDLISRTVYDAAGRRTRVVDPLGRVTAFAYDNRDRLITVTENVITTTCTGTDCNVQTQYQYDRADNRVRVIDGRGVTTQQATYDASNQQRTWVDGLGRTTTFTYDAGGRQTERQDPRGAANTVTFGYDGLDRPITTSATNLGVITAGYDALGRRLSLINGGETTSFVPDALGRPITITAPGTGAVSYGYNGRGERTAITYPDNTALSYEYWDDGQLREVRQGATVLASYIYDASGRLDLVTRSNGEVSDYSYDGADRLTDLHHLRSGQTLSRFTYQLDRLGLRRVVTETLGLETGVSTPTPTATSPGATATPTATATSTPTNTPTPTATSAGGGATSIFADSFESGSFSAWSASTTDGGDLSVSSTAALAGSFGMQALFDDTVAIFVTDDSPTNETRYRAQVRLDPNTVTIPGGNGFDLLVGRNATAVVFRLELRYASSTGYSLRLVAVNDAGTSSNGAVISISDAPQVVLVDWTPATAAGDNNGSFTLTVDGVQKDSITGLDTDSRRIEQVRLGAVSGIDTGTSGSIFLDDFQSWRGNGSPSATSTPTPTATNPGATATPTATTTPTNTPTPTATSPGATATPTATATSTPTNTPTPTATSAGGGATSIFADSFESGSFSAWSASTTDGGDLSVSSTAALAGSFGMQALFDDTVAIFVTDDSPTNETRYRAQVRLDPNTVTIPGGNGFDLLVGRNATAVVFRLELRYASSTGYTLRLVAVTDTGTSSNGAVVSISDAPQVILVDWTPATAAGDNNGSFTLTVDGVQKDSITGLDTDSRRIEQVRLGAVSGIDTGTSGSIFLDDFRSWRGDGSLQGLMAASEAISASRGAEIPQQSLAPNVYLPQVAQRSGSETLIQPAVIALNSRTVTYNYDGLNRLTGATENPGTTYTYAYDRAGNRTDGGRTYNNANEVTNAGWSYDAVGNLLSDGTTSYTYDALSRVMTIARGGTTTTNTYNGDGTLVRQAVGATTTRYTQDLAAPLSQVLQVVGSSTTNYLYGQERLAAQASGTTTWYATDALGSVRQTLDNAGTPLGNASYDPWGTTQGSAISPFGFTGELQDGAGLAYLRARWYTPDTGTFTSRDSFPGFAEQPYSQHPFQYAYSNPVLWRDPSGKCVEGWEGYCYTDPVSDDWRPPTREEWIQTGSRTIDASPGIGDVKGLIEVFTGCDIITGENLGNWRWLGLIGLHELRISKSLFTTWGTLGDAYRVTRQWDEANHGMLLVLRDPEGRQLRITTHMYLRDRAMINAAKVKPKNGYIDVFVHSDEDEFLLKVGTDDYVTLPDEVLAEIIRNANPNNFKIRLFACQAGSCSNGPAQRLANLLGQDVQAATSLVTVKDSGKYTPPVRDWVRKRPE